MAQKVIGYVRFQVPAGKATPAPPVGPALGQYGVNIGQFTKDFNERTKADMGLMIPVVITVYADHSFTFITKTPPAALLIKKACGIETASGVPQRDKVATISKEDVRKIAEQKMRDLNCTDIDAAMSGERQASSGPTERRFPLPSRRFTISALRLRLSPSTMRLATPSRCATVLSQASSARLRKSTFRAIPSMLLFPCSAEKLPSTLSLIRSKRSQMSDFYSKQERGALNWHRKL